MYANDVLLEKRQWSVKQKRASKYKISIFSFVGRESRNNVKCKNYKCVERSTNIFSIVGIEPNVKNLSLYHIL